MDNPLSPSLYNRNELLTFEPKLPWVGPFLKQNYWYSKVVLQLFQLLVMLFISIHIRLQH